MGTLPASAPPPFATRILRLSHRNGFLVVVDGRIGDGGRHNGDNRCGRRLSGRAAFVARLSLAALAPENFSWRARSTHESKHSPLDGAVQHIREKRGEDELLTPHEEERYAPADNERSDNFL